ncbi:MAG: L-aspartate oxidase [Nitrospirae bacterium]|nr:L-aspartate oxidase [Nitrospirota bacterium]
MPRSVKTADFLIIGGGVAGLRAAIEVAPKGSVVVLTKDKPAESSTGYAQGGIAVALSDEDEVGIHHRDTIKAGNGLCKEEAVKVLVEEGPAVILELISWGAEFDREGSRLAFTREAAHSRRRILHAHGDSTGKELERVLIKKVRTFPSVSRYDFAFTTDLIIEDNRCVGAVVLKDKEVIPIYAKAVILATGGAGQLYSRTTNPLIATGDGIAIAYRAGAVLDDMEFIQFHPTTLYSPSAPQFLLSEAMRGEGAILKNIHGKRFMPQYHEMAELAPRDIVTRAIISEMVKTKAKHVYLDLTHLDKDFVKRRFPGIYSTCLLFDIDITEDLIPVCPAAHYIMGGVKSGLNGETNINGLFAAGEAACTGVHGANRLASNSLLEGMVYGARAGKAASELRVEPAPLRGARAGSSELRVPKSLKIPKFKIQNSKIDIEKIRSSLRRLMWNKVGIIRCKESLTTAKEKLREWDSILKAGFTSRAELELKNMLTTANLIVESALLREGSIGAHYRSDFKEKGENWQRHALCQKGRAVEWSNA